VLKIFELLPKLGDFLIALLQLSGLGGSDLLKFLKDGLLSRPTFLCHGFVWEALACVDEGLGDLLKVLIGFMSRSIGSEGHSGSSGIADFGGVFDVVKAVDTNLIEQLG
jgi:hypothetical protein